VNKAIDLFAGIGGWSLAAKNLGMDTLGIEVDKQTYDTSVANGFDMLHSEVSIENPDNYSNCNIITASPPCQGFSMQGKQQGWKDIDIIQYYTEKLVEGYDLKYELYNKLYDKRSLLVAEPLKWALKIKPQFMAWEQVPYVYHVWEVMLPQIEAMGYSVKLEKLNSEEYGVAQTRERVILIARKDGKPAKMPPPTNQKYIKNHPKRGDLGVPPWLSMEDVLPERKGWNYRAGLRKKSGLRPSTLPAPTIAFGQDYNNHKWIKDGIEEKLSLEEALVLQGFPRDYKLEGSKMSKYAQVGNAIPVKLAQNILSMV
jgi:DNA (cytosine-5)-methyltransferase 1